MTDKEWLSQVVKALTSEDPEEYSSSDKNKRLIGHSVFACVTSGNRPELEIVQFSPDLSHSKCFRLLLTHKIPGKESGEHVIVIGMNPSKARSFSGKLKGSGDNVPETDKTATFVRGWLESEELAQAKRLTMINLLPVVETESQNVKHLLRDYSSIDFRQIFHQLLRVSLVDEQGNQIPARIICAWGNPKGKNWVREGMQWFQEFCTSPDNRDIIANVPICRLEYSRGKNIPPYPPHPLNRSLKGNNNSLMPYSLENE